MENLLLSKNDLALLTQIHANPCVSIYAPIERDGNRSGRDELRLGQLIRQAETMLASEGFSSRAAELVQPIERVVQDGFYNLQGEKIAGLAFFVSPDIEKTYLASHSTPEVVRVDDHFDLRPLMGLLPLEEEFYVLAVSTDQMLLYRGSQASLTPVILPPNTATDVTASVGKNPSELMRDQQVTEGSASVEFVGITHSTSSEDREYRRINDYIRSVCRTVDQFLNDKKAPLIIATTEAMQPLVEKHLGYPYLVKEGIQPPMAADKSSPAELFEQAQKILERYDNERKRTQLERYRELVGTKRSASSVADILQTALGGQIEVLLASSQRNLYGRYDRALGKVEIHEERHAADTELVSLAVMEAFNHGAKVYLVEDKEFPNDCPMGAILRW